MLLADQIRRCVCFVVSGVIVPHRFNQLGTADLKQARREFSELINAWDDPREIHVIAESVSDIEVLSGELQAEVGEEKREGVFFCASSDPDTLYDWDGNVVAPKSSKEAGDASGDIE